MVSSATKSRSDSGAAERTSQALHHSLTCLDLNRSAGLSRVCKTTSVCVET